MCLLKLKTKNVLTFFLSFTDKQQDVDVAHVKDQQDQHTDLRPITSGRPSARREGALQPQPQQASNAANTATKPVPDSKPDTIHLPRGTFRLNSRNLLQFNLNLSDQNRSDVNIFLDRLLP